MEEDQKLGYSKCDISYMDPEVLGSYISFDALFPAVFGFF
jgi:hypothetical protein